MQLLKDLMSRDLKVVGPDMATGEGDRVIGTKGWWWEDLEAPAPGPGEPDRDAEHRWENEGGNPPRTGPPDANPRKHL